MLEKLEEEEKLLESQLVDNRRKQKEIHTKLFCIKHNISIGDTIEFFYGTKKSVGIIHHFEYGGVVPYYPVIRLFNKNGEVGQREERCWYSSLDTMKVLHSVKSCT